MADMLYTQVADSLIKSIQDGVLKENDKLSERKLALEYNVSRTVIRESMKLLNEKGLVYTVYGKGSYVRIPDDKELIGKFEDAMDSSRVAQTDVVEARELLEYAMVHLMIERVNEKDLQVLTELHKRMRDNLQNDTMFVDLDEKFHLALSICTHNRVLSIMTGTLNHLADRQLLLQSKAIRDNASLEHGHIIEALQIRDEEMLLSAMRTHIKCIRNHTEEEEIQRLS